MNHPFNIRIYGILIENNKILIVKEPFMGNLIYKFPGGGMEFGEGTIDCLKREFKEELNLDIEIEKHLYTQYFFLVSALNKNEQIFMVYYKVKAKDIQQLENKESDNQELKWIDLSPNVAENLSLPTDRLVIELVVQDLKNT